MNRWWRRVPRHEPRTVLDDIYQTHETLEELRRRVAREEPPSPQQTSLLRAIEITQRKLLDLWETRVRDHS